MNGQKHGQVTIPTDIDVVAETLDVIERLGADAIRDCDGTEFPEALTHTGARVYATYYTTRKDNAWARAHPEEWQQCYIMTGFHTAGTGPLAIPLMQGISPELMKVNDVDDITRWWEVMDRSSGESVPPTAWRWNAARGEVILDHPTAYHEYTVSFLAYLIWDPVHMYNAVVNGWKDVEHQLTFDVRQPRTHAHSLRRLRRFVKEHPYVDVIRYTTFFHQFTLIFDELRREKYVDWYGYSASVSPYILEQFEREAGYTFRPEFIIDQGYYNNQYRVPSREYRDFMAFQRREVAKLAQEFVELTHELGREAMMFLGDHWIGTEPFMDEFKSIGLDAVVGSVGNGSTLRLISDIQGVKYTEGRFLPYFFPDTFNGQSDPVREARDNWITARRAMLRKPIDRIGYGGYLKLAVHTPGFIDALAGICDEFRTIYANVHGCTAYCAKTVAVLNCWGRMRAWGCHMVHHAIYHKSNYSYEGVIEALSGAAFDVRFLSFDEVMENPRTLDDIDVLLIIGDGDTAHTGGTLWEDARLGTAIRGFIYRGGGFIGIGEPSGHQYQGHYLQLASALGVETERGFTLGYDKYNWEEHPDHFILEDVNQPLDFGEGKRFVYALPGAQVLVQREREVQLAVNEYGQGRCVYVSGLPYSTQNARLLHRAILWAAHAETELLRWFSSNPNVEVNAYSGSGKYCTVNNSYDEQATTIWRGDGSRFELRLCAGEIRWFDS